MTKVLKAAQSLVMTLALAMGALGMFCGVEQSAQADLEPIAFAAAPCQPTDTTVGSAPCYNKAGAQCYNGGNPYTCTASLNGSNCTCGF